VNKDGYDDVIVGQCHYDSSTLYESEVYVFHGSKTGLSATADWTEDITQADAYFGYSVGTAGDVNGDTYADVIIGAPWYHDGQTDEGAAFVYHGSMTGLPSDPDWTVESNREGAYFGFSVGTAGNVNGDVYSDVIVGAPYDSNEQSTEGRVYAFHGSAAGLSASANWIAEIDQADAHFGISVATAGDVNDDGYSDVIIGADYYTNDRNREGAAYVYTGSGTGLSNTPGWTTEGNSSFAYYGFSVGTAGDVNGNDYSDVIVGAYGFEYDYSFEGKAYIYHDSVGVWFQNFLPLLRK